MRRLYPTHKVIDDFPEALAVSITIDDSIALKLLKKWGQQDGWKSLEDSVRETIDNLP